MEAATLAFARDLSSDAAEDLLDAVLGHDAGSLASFVTESPGAADLLLPALAKACSSADEELLAPALEVTEAMASGSIASLRWLASSRALMASILSVIDTHLRPEIILGSISSSAEGCDEDPEECLTTLSQGLKTAAVICSVEYGRTALLSAGTANDNSTTILLRAATSIANVVTAVCCSKEALQGFQCRGSETIPSTRGYQRTRDEPSFDDYDFGRRIRQRIGNKESSRAAEPLLLSSERLSGMPREVAAGMMEDALSILAQPLLLLAGKGSVVPLCELPGDAATEACDALRRLWHSTSHPSRAPRHASTNDGSTRDEPGGSGSCDEFSDSGILSDSARRYLAACVARLAAESRRAAWAADNGRYSPHRPTAAGTGECNRDGGDILRWLLHGSVTGGNIHDHGGNHDRTHHSDGESTSESITRHQQMMTPERFFRRNWEKKPVHIRGGSGETGGNKFDRLGFRDIGGGSNSSSFEDTMIEALCRGGYSCPQMNSTDTDALEVLRRQAAEGTLASPVAIGVDLVAIKEGQNLTPGQGQQEVAAEEGHPQQSAGLELEAAKKAYREGFTLARQGLARLSPGVFETVAGLSSAMGLSAGANAYLTPAGSQGLAPHYDDHCVFVLQIAGSKTWRVCDPRPEHTLPRLGRRRLKVEAITNEDQGFKEFVLAAGDCLYIPRGFPHVAQTDGANPSFHLSLGLEVEPFMEWSAALHVALRLIHQARSEPSVAAADAAISQEAASAAIRAVENTSEDTRRDSILASSAEELLHLIIEDAAAAAVPELRAACSSVACGAIEAWMTIMPGPEGKGEDPDGKTTFCLLGQRVFCGPERCHQFEHALSLLGRQQQQKQQPSHQAGPLLPGAHPGADVCEDGDESPACWRNWLPLPHKGVTVREEEEESCSTQVESDICNCREGLQRAFEVLREQMVSVFTNDQERRCAELWASVKTAMRRTADKCLKTRDLVQAAHLAISQKPFN